MKLAIFLFILLNFIDLIFTLRKHKKKEPKDILQKDIAKLKSEVVKYQNLITTLKHKKASKSNDKLKNYKKMLHKFDDRLKHKQEELNKMR